MLELLSEFWSQIGQDNRSCVAAELRTDSETYQDKVDKTHARIDVLRASFESFAQLRNDAHLPSKACSLLQSFFVESLSVASGRPAF